MTYIPDSANNIYSKIGNPKLYHGIESRATIAPLPANITTTTFTITTGTTPLTYYRNGVKTVVSTNKSVTISSWAWMKYIYFTDDAGTLTSFDTFQWVNWTITYLATVNWNGTNYGLVNDERHSYNRDINWHTWAHSTIWARYGSGLVLSASWTGNTATMSLSAGSVYDEDIVFSISTITTARQFYQTWASTYWFDSTATTYPCKLGANNRPGYVDSTTFVWTQVASAANRFLNYFCYATTDLMVPFYVFTETVAASAINSGTWYNSLAAARAVPFPNLSAFPLTAELKPIYRLIVRADGVVQAIDFTQDDYRTSSSIPFGAGTTLTSASSVTETNYGNVQTAVNTIIANLWWISTSSVVNSWTNYQAWSKWGLLLARFVGTASQGINVMSDATATPTINVATLTTNSNVTSDNSMCVPIIPNYYYRIDMRWTWTWSWVFFPFN